VPSSPPEAEEELAAALTRNWRAPTPPPTDAGYGEGDSEEEDLIQPATGGYVGAIRG
jgi:hypothetical protein